MIEKDKAVKDVKVRILGKSIGVSLNKAKMNIGDVAVINGIKGDPWGKKGGSILAHKIGTFPVYTFSPQDLEVLVM